MGHVADAKHAGTVRRTVAEDSGIFTVHRTANPDNPLTFIISSESVDLAGDIVVQAGLKPINSRIPAQIDHGGSMHDVIGSWRNIQTKGDKTFADLHLLPAGVSRTADLVRALAAAGLRLAASIGFKPD